VHKSPLAQKLRDPDCRNMNIIQYQSHWQQSWISACFWTSLENVLKRIKSKKIKAFLRQKMGVNVLYPCQWTCVCCLHQNCMVNRSLRQQHSLHNNVIQPMGSYVTFGNYLHIKVEFLVNEISLVSTPDLNSDDACRIVWIFRCAKDFSTIMELHIQCSGIAVFVNMSVFKLQCVISASPKWTSRG